MSRSSVVKGKLLEEHVATQLREKGIDLKAYRSHGSGNGNSEKADIWTSLQILGQNVGFECKNHATICFPEWWRQTKKLESLGREPVLVFKQFGESLTETKVVIYLDTFLELAKAANNNGGEVTEEPKEINWQKRRAFQNLQSALKEVLKYNEEE